MQMKPGVADDMQARLNALTAKLPANTMNLLAQSTAALASGGGASAPPTAQLTTTASPATATAAAAPAAATAAAKIVLMFNLRIFRKVTAGSNSCIKNIGGTAKRPSGRPDVRLPLY